MSLISGLVKALHDAIKKLLWALLDKLQKLFGKLFGDDDLLRVQGTRAYMRITRSEKVFVGASPELEWEAFLSSITDENCRTRVRKAFGNNRVRERIKKVRQAQDSAQSQQSGTTPNNTLAQTMAALVEAVRNVLKEIDACFEQINWCAVFDKQTEAPGGEGWIKYIERTGKGCGGKDFRGNNQVSADQEFRAELAANPGRKLHGHHIVPKEDNYTENAVARRILCKHGINPYTGCENLAILPNRGHSQNYSKYVCQQLQKADPFGRDEVIKTLRDDIAEKFAKNQIPGGSTCR